jgi:hypothetical protein
VQPRAQQRELPTSACRWRCARNFCVSRLLILSDGLFGQHTDANVANITAQGLANARVSQAHGYATSRVLEAQADADAQRLLTGSLTPLYVQYLMSQKWNGALPQYSIGGTGSSGVGALFSIPAPAATATPTPSATATAEPTARR